MPTDRTVDSMTGALVVLGSFAAYALTAAPMVTSGDAGELVAASFTLGVAHPPGYPLFALVGRAASLVPLGDVAFRMNVMSGACMSFAVLAAYLLMRAVSDGHRLAHAGLALAAAFCSESWRVAASTEVYTLQICLSLSALLMLVRWRKGADVGYLYAAAFAAGLSVAAHYTALVFLPAFGLMFALGVDRDARVKAAAMSSAFFLMGTSVFAYLPVRSATSPPVNWGRPDDVYSFVYHISRASYGDLGAFRLFSGGAPTAGTIWSAGSGMLAIAAVVVLAGVMLALLKARKGKTFRLLPAAIAAVTSAYLLKLGWKGVDIDKVAYLSGLVAREFWWPVLLAAGYGLYRMYKNDRDASYVFMLLFACLTVVMLYRVPMDPHEYALPLAKKFFASWFVVGAVLAGAGVSAAAARLKDVRMSAVPAAAALLLAALLAVVNHGREDNSRLFWPHDYSVDLMRTFDEDAIFLAEGDHHPFLGIYQKTVEMARPDVTILEATGNIFGTYEEMASIYSGPSTTVYCSQASELDYFTGISVVQAGIINRWDVGGRVPPDPVPYYTFRAEVSDAEKAAFPDRSVYANFNYHMARRLVSLGRDELAEGYLRKALKAGGDLVWVRVNAGNIYKYWRRPAEAEENYLEAVRLAPARPTPYVNLGNLYLSLGEREKAGRAFREAARLDPSDPESRKRLEDINSSEGGDFR